MLEEVGQSWEHRYKKDDKVRASVRVQIPRQNVVSTTNQGLTVYVSLLSGKLLSQCDSSALSFIFISFLLKIKICFVFIKCSFYIRGLYTSKHNVYEFSILPPLKMVGINLHLGKW